MNISSTLDFINKYQSKVSKWREVVALYIEGKLGIQLVYSNLV